VAGHSAVGVDDDLAAGETTVGVRPAQLEAAGRVDQHPEVVVGEGLGQHRPDHVLDQIGLDGRLGVDPRLVLGRDQHGAQPHRPTVLVLDRDLRLAVGSEVGDGPGAADLRQLVREPVGEPDRQRHQVVGLVAGVAEHHPLVAGALGVEDVLTGLAGAGLVGGVDALRDVG
jgi:hypothetical protein